MLNEKLLKSLETYIANTYKDPSIPKIEKGVNEDSSNFGGYDVTRSLKIGDFSVKSEKCFSSIIFNETESAQFDPFKLDESLIDTIYRLMDKQGLTDVELYKRSDIDRKLFSKIRNSEYKPSKDTVYKICIGLKLSLREAEKLLKKAGFALSNSDKRDVILKYYLKNNEYDFSTIDETLLHFDFKTLSRYE